MTHKSAKDEASQEDANESGGHAEDTEQEITDGQIEQENVGHRAHGTVQCERDDDQQIAHYGQHEDDAVRQNEGQENVPAEDKGEGEVAVAAACR